MSKHVHPERSEPPDVGPEVFGFIGQSSTAAQPPVSRRFVVLYALAYIGTILLFLAPLLVSLSLKINALVGTEQAPTSLSLVAGTGAFLAMFANPFFGKMSDRTTSRLGMRRPWMVTGLLGGSVGILVVALAPSIPVVLVGWCIAQVFFNALLAALDRRAPRPGSRRPTRPGRGCPGHLPAHRLRQRHLRCAAVHRQHPRHVPGPLRDRRDPHPAVRRRH